jgi:hypothetical protein
VPYAPIKDVYRELRDALSPWAQAAGFRRLRGTAPGWEKPIDDGRRLVVRFEGSSAFVDPDSGHSLTGWVETLAADRIERQALFTTCLLQPELDRLARVHGRINARRPRMSDDMKPHVNADTVLGLHLRELYDPSPKYREGQHVPLAYYDIQDVRELLAFVVDTVPVALERFVAGTNPKMINDTPPHLIPKWLKDLTK